MSLRPLYHVPISGDHVGFHFGGINTWWPISPVSGMPSPTDRQQAKKAAEGGPGLAAGTALDWSLAAEVRKWLGAAITAGEPTRL